VKRRPPTDLSTLASDLNIGPAQLQKLRVKYKTQERLLATLQRWWVETREQPNLLARHSTRCYVHDRAEAMPGQITESGYEDEPEAVHPDEIETFRASREARLRHQQERSEAAGELLGAMNELRSALDHMSPEVKRRSSRALWVLRSRLDAAERQLRRDLAA
jgi:hypothetical protein